MIFSDLAYKFTIFENSHRTKQCIEIVFDYKITLCKLLIFLYIYILIDLLFQGKNESV